MKRNIAARPTTKPNAAPRILATSAAALLALCLLPQGLSAATNNWNNTDNNQQWDDNNNWSTALKPVLTDDAVFPTPVPGSSNLISLSSSETANSLTFHNTYALTNTGAATLTLNPANGGNVTVDAGFTAGVQVQVIGTSALTKLGGGTLSISNGANTYSGGTVLNAGTLDIDVLYVPNASPPTNAIQTPLGTGTLTINGGTIGTGIGPTSLVPTSFSNGSAMITNAVVINNSFGVSNVVLSSTINGAPASAYAVGTHLVDGPYVPGATPALISNGVAFAGQTTLANTGVTTINTDSGFLALTGQIVGANSGGLTFSGNSAVLIGGQGVITPATMGNDLPNTYAGATTVAGGYVLLSKDVAGAYAIPGNLTIAPGAYVQYDSLEVPNQINPSANVAVNGTLDTAGLNQQVNSLSGTGVVRLDSSAFAGTYGVAVLKAGILTVSSGNFSGQIVDNGLGGQLVKTGSGTLILGGNNTYVGSTTVNGGTLQVDGAIASRMTMVNAGATLAGKGIIGGALNNTGSVQPGNASAPDTLTVNGNYTQASNGNLRIGLGSSTSYGRLAVNGTAALGGSVTAVSVNGFKPKVGDHFVILTATGGVNGQFNAFQDQTGSGLLLFQPNYSVKNQVSLSTTFTSLFDIIQNSGQATGNRLACATAVDQVATNPKFTTLINFLSGQTVNQCVADMDLIAHEEISSLHNASASLGSVQTGNIGSRTEQIRSGFSGFSALGFHMAGAGPAYSGGFAGPNGEDDGKDTKEMKEAAPYDPRLGVFLTGVGEWVNVDDTANARGYDVATGGFTLGVDYKITPNFALGINAGYANTGVDLNDGSHMRINSGKLGLYSTFFTGGFYIDTAVQGGYSSYDSQRAALAGDARGSTDGGDLEVLFGTGYDFHAGGLTIGPTGNFQYGYNEFNSFSEHGSLVPLTYPSQSQDSYRTAFGMHAVYDWKAGGMTLRPELRLAWQHEYGTTTDPVTAQFTGANNNFTVDGPEIGRDSLLVGVGMTMIINERTSTYLYYNGEYARTNFLSNTVSGGIRITF